VKATLVLPEALTTELQRAAAGELETAGVLLASVFQTSDGNLRVLGRRLRWVPEEAYQLRQNDQLDITSDGYIDALAEAEALAAIAIWFHTHPGDGSSPRSSEHDAVVDKQLSDLFRLRSGQDFYGALVVAVKDGGLRFTGHLDDGQRHVRISRIWSVGDRLALIVAANSRVLSKPGAAFDRNVRAFGGGVQRVLSELRVGLVGCGGTGSAVAEQLVRLGVRHFHLVDPDVLTESNVTRVYGSTPADVGTAKVEVLARHLQVIAPDTIVTTDASMITLRGAALGLIGSDVIFGCTDDNAGRLVLSRLSTYLLTPVIDCGVLLSSDSGIDGLLSGIDGRVTTLVPGAGCLICRGRVDLQRANSELMTPEERVRLVDEGYAPALQGVEPAVVTFTTLVAATAVSELLERLIGYGPEPRPTEVLLRIHDREVSTNVMAPRPRHYCDPDSGKLGLGMTEPFLEQTWP
jgi:ThiF family